jgi:hypothetical protein
MNESMRAVSVELGIRSLQALRDGLGGEHACELLASRASVPDRFMSSLPGAPTLVGLHDGHANAR